jgi:hypothetical protein
MGHDFFSFQRIIARNAKIRLSILEILDLNLGLIITLNVINCFSLSQYTYLVIDITYENNYVTEDPFMGLGRNS